MNRDYIDRVINLKFKRKQISALKVVAGQVSLIDMDTNEKTVPVFSLLVNNEYNSTTKQNDIALLKVFILCYFNQLIDEHTIN